MNKLISGAVGVEVLLVTGQKKYYFPENRNLRNKRVKHVDFCFFNDLTVTPSNNPIAEVNSDIFVTLRESNTQRELISQLPATEFNASGNRLFINKIVDLQNSYFEITGSLNDLSGKAFYFVFWYDEPKVWGLIPQNCRTRVESFDITLSGDRKTYFREFRNLVDKRYQNIILSLPTVTPSGVPGITNLKTKYITLSRRNEEFFQNVPLFLLFQADQNFKLRFQNIQLDFLNSYVIDITGETGKAIFFNAEIDDNK